VGRRKNTKRWRKAPELAYVDINADTSAFSEAIKRFSEQLITADEMSAHLAEWAQSSSNSNTLGVSWSRTAKPGKRITSIGAEWTTDVVDVTTFQDTTKQFTPGLTRLALTDQDGEPVPFKLYQRLEELFTNRTDTHEEDVKRVLADWNCDGPEPKAFAPIGHKSGCPYRGSHHFPCTCQPPSLFGITKSWYCDCCERPRAMTQYGLCEICFDHQYSSGHVADAEHEAL
jgi:hypothetical protein